MGAGPLPVETPHLSAGRGGLERGLLANRVEVGIVAGVRAEALRLVDCAPEVLDGVVGSAGEALAAGKVVEQPRVLGVRLDHLASSFRSLRVAPFQVETIERRPELPAVGLIGLPRRASDREDRRLRLLGEGGALHTRA